VPLEELFRRMDAIVAAYGPGTVVQISGGEPTLRNREELVAIMRGAADRRLVPALFTNGIRASRELLRDLKKAGLRDIAFHVDMTQNRHGFASETALHILRKSYIERARGLGLRVMFNTTIFPGNYGDVPEIARFFVEHAREVVLASFQIQAETGRGVLRSLEGMITQLGLIERLSSGAGAKLSCNVPMIGHPDCNRYTGILVADGRVVPLFDNPDLWRKLVRAFRNYPLRPKQPIRNGFRGAAVLVRRPLLLAEFAAYATGRVWRLRHDLLRSRGRIDKLSFHVHNFMDETKLERRRCEACVFKVATAGGAISMCVHNAKRDTYILAPVPRLIAGRQRLWDPTTGQLLDDQILDIGKRKPMALPAKRRKGRTRDRSGAMV